MSNTNTGRVVFMPTWLILLALPFYAAWFLFLVGVLIACALVLVVLWALQAAAWLAWFVLSVGQALHTRYTRRRREAK